MLGEASGDGPSRVKMWVLTLSKGDATIKEHEIIFQLQKYHLWWRCGQADWLELSSTASDSLITQMQKVASTNCKMLMLPHLLYESKAALECLYCVTALSATKPWYSFIPPAGGVKVTAATATPMVDSRMSSVREFGSARASMLRVRLLLQARKHQVLQATILWQEDWADCKWIELQLKGAIDSESSTIWKQLKRWLERWIWSHQKSYSPALQVFLIYLFWSVQIQFVSPFLPIMIPLADIVPSANGRVEPVPSLTPMVRYDETIESIHWAKLLWAKMPYYKLHVLSRRGLKSASTRCSTRCKVEDLGQRDPSVRMERVMDKWL